MSEVPAQFCPRLCHVVKWPEFNGYGFNLHAEKGKAGQFIGKVDENSPAEAAGLKEGDRIVEVNGTNIGNENHQQVVGRIKSGGEETRLLVVDNDADEWYKEQKKVVKGDLEEVRFKSAARNWTQTQEETVTPEPEPEPEPEPVYDRADPAVVETLPEPGVNGDNGVHLVNGDLDHRPRLCHLKIWPHFQGYGFNLHAERDKPGQFIGLVDDDSPASTACLKVNDRIIEVNGENIEQETHTNVIKLIKSVPGETKLLVVDHEADLYYRAKGVTVSSSMGHVEYNVSTDPNDVPAAADVAVVESQVEDVVVAAPLVLNGEAEPGEPENVVEEVVEQEAVTVVETAPVNGVEDAAEEEAKEEEEAKIEEEVVIATAIIGEEAKQPEEEPKVEPEEEDVAVVPTAVEEEEAKVEEVVESSTVEQVESVQPVAPPEPEVEEPPKEVEDPPKEVEDVPVNGIQTEPEPEPEYTLASPKHEAPVPPVQEEPPKPAPAPQPQPVKAGDEFGFGLTAAEMKERLKSKKKGDPRHAKKTFEQKYKEFQKL